MHRGGHLISGEPEFDAPVLDPVVVSTLGGISEDRERPFLMAVTLDPDDLPGLAEAFEQHRTGHQFDVSTQWSVLVSRDVDESPVAHLHIDLLDIDLRFIIRFVVDEYKRSLLAAAQTGLVELWEPALSQAMLTMPAEEAYGQFGAIGLTAGDADPLRRVLQQRFDLPMLEVREELRVVPQGEGQRALDDFVGNARLPDSVALATQPGFVAVVIVDPTASDVVENAGPLEARWGHWAILRAGPLSLARVDVLVDGNNRLASWLVPNPSAEVIRATSAGPHVIVVLTEQLPEGREDASRLLSQATGFPVRAAPDAMRALRAELGA